MKNRIVRNVTLFYFFIAIVFTLVIHLLVPLVGHAAELSKPIVLGPHYDVFRDPSNDVEIDDILSGEYDKSFVASTQEYLNFWHTDDTIWLRLDTDEIIKNKEESYWLELIDKLENIEVFLLKEDGTYDIQKGGFSNLDSRKIKFRSILFTINDPSIQEIYIKLEGALPLTVISSLYTTDGFIEKIISYKFLTGAFYGFLTALSIYNLFLFFSLKERSYLYYVFYMWSFMVFQATMNTFDIELMGHLLPEWFFTRSLVLSCNLLLLCMILFGREFLELKKYLPLHNRVLTVSLWITIFSFVAVFIIPDVYIVNDFTIAFTMLVLLFLWISGLRLLLRGYKIARFYMVGWTVLLGSIIIQGLGFIGIIPFHPRIYEDVPATAAIFEAIFLSLALGDKINIIKKEHQDMQQELNETLEYKVKERTQQLEKATLELERLANTDRLTQIPNRVRLDYVLETELKRAQNELIPFSVILLDVDHFKEVNDQFGHQVGDIVLIEAAKLLKDNIRDMDTIGRWGGEEFLVICPQTTLEDALQLSKKLRKQLENHSFPIVERKTSSFGVTCYVQGDTLNTLIARCDKALYHAKDRGRNCVEYLIR
ncbi:sensor domain-containing diguanylate cyclase [Bacillus sp. FJAT-42315]|uniref:sensor domain-containing diguanylate cyclase n=1 Tax=Bacillus sp. FJAT-42315 TaxID=2014077 RepID=UPI000C23E52E|nr:diguanylate cyclase [Bacillus sp. FJAT-42315]